MEKRILLPIWTILLGFYVAKVVSAQQINIDISSYNPANETTHTFYQFLYKSDENTTEVIVSSNSTNSNGFYILQAHSFRYNISLLNYDEVAQIVTGHNVGIVHIFKAPFITSSFIDKLTDRNVTILVAVTVYDNAAPIPGGCSKLKNGTSRIISNANPLIQVKDGRDIIAINSEAPSIQGLSCNDSKNELKVEIYHKFLSSQNFDSFQYYQGILSMLSPQDIRNNGRLVSTLKGSINLEKLFSSYIGVGEVFAILVTRNETSSAYVPSISYGEDIEHLIYKQNEGANGEGLFVTLFSVLPFISFVIVYWGHSLFHFTTFALGLSCGTIISFFVLSKEGASTIDNKFLFALLIGVLYGAVWVSIWYKCGVPLLSATLAFLHTGALLTAIIYHCGIADDENFHNDGLYWSVFFGLMFISWFILSVFTMHGHIFSCAFLGSYILMITTLNYWMGANLQYVVINVYRRMFVPGFNVVVLDPPYQHSDRFIALCGVLFLIHGYWVQVRKQRGKPPFPPHNSHRFEDERSPLLGYF